MKSSICVIRFFMSQVRMVLNSSIVKKEKSPRPEGSENSMFQKGQTPLSRICLAAGNPTEHRANWQSALPLTPICNRGGTDSRLRRAKWQPVERSKTVSFQNAKPVRSKVPSLEGVAPTTPSVSVQNACPSTRGAPARRRPVRGVCPISGFYPRKANTRGR